VARDIGETSFFGEASQKEKGALTLERNLLLQSYCGQSLNGRDLGWGRNLPRGGTELNASRE